MLLKLEKGFDRFADIIGYITSVIMILMILNVFYDVIMRYFFNTGSIAMQEMEWHFFSAIILLGISYTLKEDGHVRVDLIYDRLSDRKKSFINMFGVIFFILPISLLIGIDALDFVKEAYISGEQSGDPGGLTNRWIVKALIPLSFLLLILTSIGFFIKNLNVYKGIHKLDEGDFSHRVDDLVHEIEEHKNQWKKDK